MEWYHVRTHSPDIQAAQDRTEPIKTRCWRWQDKLSLQDEHTHRGSDNDQDAVELHTVQKKCIIHHDGRRQFLIGDAYEQTIYYAPTNQAHPTRNHR